MGVCKMADMMDYFNIYIMGSIELLLQLYFLARIINKKVRRSLYCLYNGVKTLAFRRNL